MYTLSKHTPLWLSSKLVRTLVLPQFNANDRAYIRQYFAMLALLRAASHHSWFRVTVCDAYQRLQHEFHAHTKGYTLSNDYLKARESTNRAVTKCISRCVILLIFETWAPSSCNIYRRSYSYACTTAITSNTSGTSFRNSFVKADSEIRIYRRCNNQRMQIDDPEDKEL